jgi:uncharacterized CHY-type Zn-finger protein
MLKFAIISILILGALYAGSFFKVPAYTEILTIYNTTTLNTTHNSISLFNIRLSHCGKIFLIADEHHNSAPTFKQLKDLNNSEGKAVSGARIDYKDEAVSTTIWDLKESTEYKVYYVAESETGNSVSEIHSILVKTLAGPNNYEFEDELSKNSVIVILPFAMIAATLLVSGISLIWFQEEKDGGCCTGDACCESTPVENQSATKPIPVHVWNPLIPLETFTNYDSGIMKSKIKTLVDEFGELEDRRLCGVCCVAPKNVVFMPCGHVYACYSCSQNLTKCPFDGKPITRKVYRRLDQSGSEEMGCFQLIQSKRHRNNYDQGKDGLLMLYETLKADIQQYRGFEYCGICGRRPRELLFNECGHVYSCRPCAKIFDKCPLDHKPITQSTRLFFA